MKPLHTTENNNQTNAHDDAVPLPKFAYSTLNRCNVPSAVLGSYGYQLAPIPLQIDCVNELHADFFKNISLINDINQRNIHFKQYMCSAFLLEDNEAAGLTQTQSASPRHKLDYLRLLRGWMFAPDGIEAAVLKRWVESRFGLLTLNHGGLLASFSSVSYKNYHADYVSGLYNSNALEAQLDLLYHYCQYELQRLYHGVQHLSLYRGINNIAQHTQMTARMNSQQSLLLNNLSSFSSDAYQCETFGDIILAVQVPLTKILFFPELLSGVLKGENEYLVIGGIYQTSIARY